jgi:hypothetical protein
MFDDNGQDVSTPCEVFRVGEKLRLVISSQQGTADWDFDLLEFTDALESARSRLAEGGSNPRCPSTSGPSLVLRR